MPIGAFVGLLCAGKHEGMTKYTIGQRARIPGRLDANKYGL
jgi:tRNA U34 2-thiouridine synthase MnmA/TrmU